MWGCPNIIGIFWIIYSKEVLLIGLNKKQGSYWIANNSAAWDLDKCNKHRFEFEYACADNFSTTI
jgi:hypothetical protein